MQRILCSTAILLIMLGAHLSAKHSASQHAGQDTSIDSDHDGLSDDLEEALLQQYKPLFMVSQTDCSSVPAEFISENGNPTVLAEDATI